MKMKSATMVTINGPKITETILATRYKLKVPSLISEVINGECANILEELNISNRSEFCS